MMAATVIRLFCYVCILCILNTGAKELIVTHAPKYISFHEQTQQPLQASDVPKVISHTLGLPSEDVEWKGIQQGSVFQRPKANVLISVVGFEGMNEKPLQLKNVASFPLIDDVPSLDIGELLSSIQNVFFEKSPFMLDAGMDNDIFDINSEFDLFRKIPDTMRKMSQRLMDTDSVIQLHPVGTLNTTFSTHAKLMGELQMIQDVFNSLQEKMDDLPKDTPDLLSFTVTGLRDIAEKHGPQATETDDAQKFISDFVSQITDNFRKLYKDNVMVEVLTTIPKQQSLSRKTRSLKAVSGGLNINLSKDYDENYPIIFNIILWFMIIWAIVLFVIVYGMWFMDPGRDSIIYRMTTTRLKKD